MAKSSQSRKRGAERRTQRKRQTQIGLIIGIGAGALLLALVLILLSQKSEPAVAAVDYTGLNQSVVDLDGAPGLAIGPADAPVTLLEFSDFSCPHCHDLASTMHRIIDEYVRTGNLKLVYVPVSFVNPATSVPAAKAAICAGEQGKFWEMHDQIWAMFDLNGPATYTQSLLTGRANQIGLDQVQFTTCFTSTQVDAQVQAVLTLATARGVNGTPSLFVNDIQVPFTGPDTTYDGLAPAIQAALGG